MSKTRLRSADFSINEICKKSSYKSYTSAYDFKVILKKSIRDLHKLGYKVGNIKGLKTKHVLTKCCRARRHWNKKDVNKVLRARRL